jgi:hypothetical protein
MGKKHRFRIKVRIFPKQIGNDIEKGAKVVGKQIKEVVLKYDPLLATMRNSYLMLLKINFKGSAALIWRAAKDKKSPAWRNVSNYWRSIGGNLNKLQTAIDQGIKVEYKHHKNEHKEGVPVKYTGDWYDTPDNYDPATASIAAAIIAAVPVILKMALELKKGGISETPETEAAVRDETNAAVDKAAQDLVNEHGLTEDKDGEVEVPAKAFKSVPNYEGALQSNVFGVPVIYILGVAVVAYFLIKKSK